MEKGMILGVIQARMRSTRLPGKALHEIQGKPLLRQLHDRMAFSRFIDKIVIATAEGEANRPIWEFAKEHNIDYFAGSESDLTDRLYQTGKKYNADIIVRVTGDCPLVDYRIIDRMVQFYLDNRDKYDFVSNTIETTYPDGLDLDMMPFTTIEKMWNEVKDPFWREWFNSYIVEHPQDFRLANIKNDKDLSDLRWTVDYEEDFVFVKKVFDELYPKKKDFSMEDVLKLIEEDPSILEINSKYTRNAAYYEARKEENK